MKKTAAVLLAAFLLLAAGLAAQAAPARVKVTDSRAQMISNLMYVDFFLSENIKDARNFQTDERVEEPSDFPDALIDASLQYITFNGVTIAEYSDLNGGSNYVIMLHYEKDKETGKQIFRIGYDPSILPNSSLSDQFAIEVKEGMITAELKKFQPFEAVWDPNKRAFTIYQDDDTPAATTTRASGGTTGTAGAQQTTSRRTDGTRSPDSSETDPPAPAETDGTQAPDATDPAPAETGGFRPVLGSYDITSKDASVVLSLEEKTLEVTKSMDVDTVRGLLDVVEGYELRFYSGLREVGGKTVLQDGYTMKVHAYGTDLETFQVVAPAYEAGGVPTVVPILLIAVGVLLIAGAALLLFVFNKRPGASPKS